MFMFLLDVINALYFILPAYVANASPVIARGRTPLDFGLYLGKNRILGDSKTFEGIFAGLLGGLIISIIQNNISSRPIIVGLSLAIGALIGDLLSSFVKRRLNLKPGSPIPLADQLDFVIGSIAFLYLITGTLPSLKTLVVVFLITPPIHLGVNIVAYLLKLKKVPW